TGKIRWIILIRAPQLRCFALVLRSRGAALTSHSPRSYKGSAASLALPSCSVRAGPCSLRTHPDLIKAPQLRCFALVLRSRGAALTSHSPRSYKGSAASLLCPRAPFARGGAHFAHPENSLPLMNSDDTDQQ